MTLKILQKISNNYKSCNLQKIQGGASNKNFYRILIDNKSYILTDFNKDGKEYEDYNKIYNILKRINVSIPKIIEKYDNDLLLISEDFGNMRYDKILKDYPLKDILNYAVDTLIVLKNSIDFNHTYKMPQYNFKIFSLEINELPKYYFPYIQLNNEELKEEFFYIWHKSFNEKFFEFNSFLHKDFNINNLIMLPSKKIF